MSEADFVEGLIRSLQECPEDWTEYSSDSAHKYYHKKSKVHLIHWYVAYHREAQVIRYFWFRPDFKLALTKEQAALVLRAQETGQRKLERATKEARAAKQRIVNQSFLSQFRGFFG